MKSIINIGTDLHKLSRFTEILKRNGPLSAFKTKRFSERVLNKTHEMPLFEKYISMNDIENCSKILSVSWCVKESIYKTLDDADQTNFKMSDWYKINDERGRPIIGNENYKLLHPNEEFICSISHDGGLITSFIIRQSMCNV